MERPTAIPAESLAGRTLAGKYLLLSQIGSGAMGAVYAAMGPDGTRCAIKVMHPEAVADAALRERFEREAKALFSLRHANILEVRDYGVEAGLPYIVMELLEGRSLETLITDDAGLDPQLGLALGAQVLAGLAHAHSRGVLHRDIKAENVFVCGHPPALRAILLDFGLVKLDERFGPASKLTMMGSVMGSPAYLSPEQGTGEAVDARTDVYSMGVLLFELVTGRWPFEAETQIDMFRMHLMEPPPSLAAKRPGLQVRPELEAIIHRALAKKKQDRFADAGQLLAALQAIPRPVFADPGAPNRPSMRPRTSRAPRPPAPARRAPVGVVAVVALFVGVILVAALMGIGVAYLFAR